MKFKSFMNAHSALVKDVVISTCLVGATAGIVFGISAGTFKINYMDLTDSQARLAAFNNPANNYTAEKVYSAWNMKETKTDAGIIDAAPAPTDRDVTNEYWKSLHGDAPRLDVNEEAMKVDDQHPFGVALDPTTDAQAIINRYNYTAMILDGSTHTNLDRSFNQSLYSGLIDFNRNYSVPYVNSDKEEDPTKNFVAHSYRPAQDNTTEFINIYLSTFDRHYVLGLAGFNHATPLNALMTHKPSSTPGHFEAVASHANATTNKMLNGRGMILIDSNVANNQCVSSAEFRADQGAFLSALSTCMYFYHNLDIYHNKYQNLSVGIMGGVQIPTVNIYLGGFQRGVELFNSIVLTNIVNDGAQVAFNLVPEKADDQYFQSCYNTFMTLLDHSRYGDEIKPLLGDESNWTTYEEQYMNQLHDEYQIRLIKLGNIATHFTGSFAAGDAIGMTKQFLNRGAQALLVVGGPQSVDAAQEIKNQNSNCILIGVDTSMEDSDYQRLHAGCTTGEYNKDDPWHDRSVGADGSRSAQANSIIKFSALKDIRNTTQSMTQLIASGKHWDITSPAWKHQYDPDYRIDPDHPDKVFIVDLADDDVITKKPLADDPTSWIIEKFNATAAGQKGFTNDTESLIIPTSWVDQDGNVNNVVDIKPSDEMKAAGDCVFDELKHVKNIAFEYDGAINEPNLHISANAFKGNTTHGELPTTIVRCIDLSKLTNLEKFSADIGAFVDFQRPKNDGGVLCLLKRGIAAHDKDNFADQLGNAGLKDWYFLGPDMEKSICSIGFQTCGNIQNGMVSISWDGFPQLIDALSHIQYNFDISQPPINLAQAWKTSVKEYFDTLSQAAKAVIPLDYYNPATQTGEVVELDNLKSYKRAKQNGDPTLLYSQYKTTIGILGSLLNRALLEFDGRTTIYYDEVNNKFITIPDDRYVTISILQWLEWNMYVIG